MESLRNMDLRNEAKKAGIPLWRVAETLGICMMSLTRLLRKKELTEKERTAFMEAVRKAAEEDAASREGV